jgi:hypothetical protein
MNLDFYFIVYIIMYQNPNLLSQYNNNTRLILFILISILCVCIYTSYKMVTETDIGTCLCPKCTVEKFGNIKNSYVNAKTASLNAPDSLTTALAIKYQGPSDLYIEVYGYLLLANENIYRDNFGTTTDTKYQVYLKKDKSSTEKVLVGELSLDGDKVYKLKDKTDLKYDNYDYIMITVSDTNGEHDILSGSF